MRRIASLRGKLYELIELPLAEVTAIIKANGYDSITRFINRHENWQSTINDQLRVHDSSPVRPPKFKSKPIMQKIMVNKRGRPRKIRDVTPLISAITPKKRRKRRSKYGFEKIKIIGDCIFVEGQAYKVAAAAAYFGGRYNPPRKYSVHKTKMDGIIGSRVEWVA